MKNAALKHKLNTFKFNFKHQLFVFERKWVCHPLFGRFYPKRSIYRRIAAIFLAFITIASTTLFYLRPSSTEAAWFDDSYRYRQKVTYIHNAALTNAAMRLTIDTSNLTPAKMQADCDDSRFTDSTGKILRYKYVQSCDSASTIYDIVFPTVLNDTNLAWFYYGKATAASMSDISVPTGTTPNDATSFATEEKGPGPVLYYSFDEGQGTTAKK